MSAPTITKRIQLNLETREAFLLNSLYAIGLRTVAGCDDKEVQTLVGAVKDILRGDRAVVALHALTQKMRLSALSISDDDNHDMLVDP